jgi:hypothetical protein
MFCGLLPFANRVDPVVPGMPFLMFWLLLATLLAPVFVRLAAKGDAVWAAARKREQAAGAGRAVNAVVSVGILALFMVAACVLGVRAGRGRDRKDLAEWSIGGRSLGLVMTLVLMAGETYTTFSYLGAAGWSFTHGVSARCSPTSSPTGSARPGWARCSPSPPPSSCSPTSSCRSPAWARSSRP